MAEVDQTENPQSETPPEPAPQVDMATILYPPPQPDPEPIEEETPAEPEAEAPVAEVPQENTPPVEESAVGDEAESSEEHQPEGGIGEEDAGGENITSFAQLVENQEWEPEWANNLLVPIKIDGQAGEASISQLVASYQTQEAADKRLDDAKTKAQEVHQLAAQESDGVKEQLAQAAGLLQLAERLFDIDAEAANLEHLRENDPTAYLVAKDQLEEKRGALDAVKSEAGKLYQTAAAQLNAPLTSEERSKQVNEQRTKLFDLVPEWKENEEFATTQAKELVTYLQSETYGFTAEEIEEATGMGEGPPMDARLFYLGIKAMLYDAQQANVQIAQKKVLTIPKVLKPGAQQESKPEEPRDAASILYGSK